MVLIQIGSALFERPAYAQGALVYVSPLELLAQRLGITTEELARLYREAKR